MCSSGGPHSALSDVGNECSEALLPYQERIRAGEGGRGVGVASARQGEIPRQYYI